MQLRLQLVQNKLQSLADKSSCQVMDNQLLNTLVQENSKTNTLNLQISSTMQQITAAATNLTTCKNTLASLQTKQDQQQDEVANIRSLLSDFSTPGVTANQDHDDLEQLLGIINNLDFKE
jgi:hypothetical protein